jgi:hypothetical protein
LMGSHGRTDMTPSPELHAWLQERLRAPMGSGIDTAGINGPGGQPWDPQRPGMPPTRPPISRDPWYDNLPGPPPQAPTIEGDPNMEHLWQQLERRADSPAEVTPLRPGEDIDPNTMRRMMDNGQPGGEPTAELFIWMTSPRGQRVRLDGPFTNEMDAQRALRTLKARSSASSQLSVGPMPT